MSQYRQTAQGKAIYGHGTIVARYLPCYLPSSYHHAI